MAARTATSNWGMTGQLPISATNAEGHVTQAAYDYNFGVPISATDANGLVTVWQYDSFGRRVLETRPDGTKTRWTYTLCSANCGWEQSTYSVRQELLDSSDAVIRWDDQVFDAYDRLTETASLNLAGEHDKVIMSYNALGQVYRKSMPYTCCSSPTFYFENYTHDALGRVVQVQRPISASNSTLQTTTVSYQGMTTSTTDAEGKTTTKSVDPNGLLRRSQDAAGYYQSFTYDAFGSLKGVTDSAANTLFSANYVYGVQPFQVQTTDMDLGTWIYTPNALGEVTSYTDAKGAVFSMTYDKLSRPLTRSVSGDGTTTWIWGTTASSYNIGQLVSLTNTGGTTETYAYDSKSRLAQRSIIADGATYHYDYGYAANGLMDTVTYPTSTASYRVKLHYLYQAGILKQVKDYNAGTVFWQATALSPRGQVTQETLGNGLVTTRSYDAVTGWLNYIQCGIGGGACAQNQSYLWDKVGNLIQRQNSNLGLTENFYYDNVYRLDYSQLNGVTNLDLTYDNLGNITNRSDVANNATWQYDAVHKHQVKQAGSGNSYAYDDNGNMITRNGYAIGWNKANYPTSFTGSGETISLYYDGNNQRYKQVYVSGSLNETTLYLGNDLEKVTTGSSTDWRHYVRVQGRTIAIISRSSTGSNTTRYALTDYQDSPAKFTDSSGNTLVSESFTAFGARRNPQTWSGQPTYGDQTTIANITREGYTGHDALGNLGLTHMNGRVQDAITGRFLSVDPYITEPGNTQGYNRYSYVMNNPMSYIDPSGWCGVHTNAVDLCLGDPTVLPEVMVTASRYSSALSVFDSCVSCGFASAAGSMSHLSTLPSLSSIMQNATQPKTTGTVLEEVVVTAEREKKEKNEKEKEDDCLVGAGNSCYTQTDDFLSDLGSIPVVGGGIVLTGRFLAKLSVSSIKGVAKWTLGSGKSATKWANQMAKRGWTEKQIGEALSTKGMPARNVVNPDNPATRHVHPTTGRSIVVDNKTNEIIHVGGKNFDYSDWDLP